MVASFRSGHVVETRLDSPAANCVRAERRDAPPLRGKSVPYGMVQPVSTFPRLCIMHYALCIPPIVAAQQRRYFILCELAELAWQ